MFAFTAYFQVLFHCFSCYGTHFQIAAMARPSTSNYIRHRAGCLAGLIWVTDLQHRQDRLLGG